MMKRNLSFFKYNRLAVLILFLFFIENTIAHEMKNDLIVKRDPANLKISFYLKQGQVIKDSLTLYDLNFVVDSLGKVKEGLWHYIYSVRCGSDCKLRNQILLMAHHEKLQVCYAGYFSYFEDYRELYKNNLNINGSVLQDPVCSISYKLQGNISSGNISVKEYFYKGNVPDHNKGITYTYKLKCDSLNGIYFTETQFLSGNYILVNVRDKKERSVGINEAVALLNFKAIQMVYYKNNWYELNQKERRLVKFE